MTGAALNVAQSTVFVSYSRKDVEWVRRFKVMLQPVVDNSRLELWVDDQIAPGDYWRPELEAAIARSSIALLLISKEYLASRFIMDTELPALITAGARLVPVLIQPCMWKHVPMLTQVQWAHDPGRDGALALTRPAKRNDRIVRICDRLLELCPEALAPAPGRSPQGDPVSDATEKDGVAAALSRSDRAGRLDGVPPLPRFHVPRPELAELRAALLDPTSGAVGVTGGVPGLGLAGQGGIGKSVLAAELAADPGTTTFFPDGIYWVAVGDRADPVAAQLDLLHRLGVSGQPVRTTRDGSEALRAVLADRQCLLVIDDVWTAEAAAAFRVTGPRGRELFTSRNPDVISAVGARVCPVDVLNETAARGLLADLTSSPVGDLPAAADRVLVATGRVALAVALSGAAVRGGTGWEDIAAALDRGGKTFRGHPYANTFKALQAATEALSPALAAAYYGLAVFPADMAIPVPTVARYWSRLRGQTPARTLQHLRMLHDRGLLALDDGQISFHDLQHDYLLLQVENLTALHEQLLDAYRELMPAGQHRWFALPHDEPYLWDHLLHHLRGAGRWTELLDTVTDPAYLATRVFLAGPYAAETDLTDISATDPGQRTASWLRDRLAQSAHLFAGLPSLSDVAATLAGRLQDAPAAVRPAALVPVLRSPYLATEWGLTPASAWRRVLTGHAGPVLSVAFAADGRLLATAGDDRTVRLWDPTSGHQIRKLTGHTNRVRAVAFRPDSRLLASAGDDRTVRLWDPTTGHQVRELIGHTGLIHAIVFAPDGRLLASAGDDRTVRLWDPTTGHQVRKLTGYSDGVRAVAFAPDGRVLAGAGDDWTIRMWDPTTGHQVRELTGHTRWVQAVAFAPDGQLLAGAGDDGTVRLWDPTTGHQIRELTGHTDRVQALVFTPDGQLLATASDDGTVRLWDPTTGHQIRELTGHTDWVQSVAFTPDSRLLASAGTDETVRLWDPASNPVRHEPDRSSARAVAFTTDGQLLASGGTDGTVRLWDPATGHQIRKLTGHTERVQAVAFTSNGQLLASAGADGTVRLWSPTTGRLVRKLTGHAGTVSAVALAPDGRLLASGSADGTVRLWDPTTGDPVRELARHTGEVLAVAFAPDGRLLATAGTDETVRLWDPTTGDPVRELAGHTGEVLAVAFAPDGRLLASVGTDGTVRLWEPVTGGAMAVIGTDTPVESLCWAPNGLAVAGGDGLFLLDVVTETGTAP